MKWTNELPKEEGYYFLWDTRANRAYNSPTPIKVMQVLSSDKCKECKRGHTKPLIYRYLDIDFSHSSERQMIKPSEEIFFAGPYKPPVRQCTRCGEDFEDTYGYSDFDDFYTRLNSDTECDTCNNEWRYED